MSELTPADGATVAARIEHHIAGARLRVLVVGAGIAGATLAALLAQRGLAAAVIERGTAETAGGYMLGLLPLGGRVLNGLNLAPAYVQNSLPVAKYALYDRKGRLLHTYPLAPLIEAFGDWRGIERGALLRLLRDAAGPIAYGTTLKSIREQETGVAARFSDGSEAEFDLIVAADGIHSATRGLILSAEEVVDFDTGWGGFVFWGPEGIQPGDTYAELWSAGWGIGLYPVPGRVGMFVAGRHDALKTVQADAYADRVIERLEPGAFRSALEQRDRSAPAFYWRMADIRSKVWSRGRVLLLGDAAAAFLPTAGVGASAAMDSAAALADELSRADTAHMDHALKLYERRQRPRVERAQQNSRALARYMFVNGRATTFLRDQFMKFYSLERMVSDISKVMTGR